MKQILFTLILLFFTSSIFSQPSSKYIFKTTRQLSNESLYNVLKIKKANNLTTLFSELNLYSIELANDDNYSLQRLSKNSIIEFFVKDQVLEYRDTPNDPHFSEQYGLTQINAPDVWESNIGGLTGLGDTIVIAVLDKGCEINHDDLKDNIWRNNDEIPNDGLDNDNNGYIDDYFGLDLKTKNDNHNIHYHGTAVSGIIGAKGDNGIGISGVNWDVKLLPITNVQNVSDVIKAYEYVYDLRKKYNETDGKNGALIVSTNLSAGISNARPNDKATYTEWCNLYNTLGSVGILNVTAVTNEASNVDNNGDMPTLCKSDYLIPVTSTNINDNFDISRGFGKISVDIAAPGKNIYTTTIENDYRLNFTGNSAAAPFVAGAIGLFYTIPCKGFTDKIIANPSELSLKIKEYTLTYSDKHNDLTEKTLSGGRLDIYETYLHLADLCEELPTGDFEITGVYPNPTDDYIKIKYNTDNFNYHEVILYNQIGQKVYVSKFRPNIFGEKMIEINTSKYAQGIYYVSLISGDRNISKTVMIY